MQGPNAFVHDVEIQSACSHGILFRSVVEQLIGPEARWPHDTALPEHQAEVQAEAEAEAAPPARRGNNLRAPARPAPLPQHLQELIGAPRLTLAPAVAPSAIPIIPPWAHVLTHDWRSEPSEHRVEWHEDVVVFPFCGAEGANMAVTGVRQGTVVYDFAGWSLPRTGGEEEKPRIRALAAHAARALASGGSVHVSGLDRLATAGIAGVVWLDPLYVSGEGWELCPEGSGSGLATNADGAETDTEADPDPDPTVNLTHFQTHFATIVMGPGWAAEANRHRPHFVPPGDSWDAQLLRNELHKWYHR